MDRKIELKIHWRRLERQRPFEQHVLQFKGLLHGVAANYGPEFDITVAFGDRRR